MRTFRLMPVFILAILPVTQAVLASIPPSSKMTRITEIGHLKVGSSIDDYPLISKDRRSFHAHGHRARVSIFLFHPSLPEHCMNLQCGTFAKQVLSRNAILVGGTSRDYLREAGLVADGRHSGDELDPRSVLFVTDRDGKVTQIYRDAAPADLAKVLDSLPD